MKKPALFAFCACMMHANAYAADKVDSTDGRIDGDMAVALGAGATFGPRAPRGAVDLRLRYLWTVGAFVTYEDGFGASAEPKRALATGLELRPLFIARWFNGLEWGKPYADLTLDSLGLELGALFEEPQGASFGAHPGLQAGIGFEVPILPHATGPLVGFHGGVRWSGDALSAHALQGPADRALYLAITLAWQQVFGSHIVDAGDRAP